MGKGKKGGKRMNKAQLTEMLQEFFAASKQFFEKRRRE